MEKKIKELEKIIKYNFKKSLLLEKALTHKSFDNNINNEKLEFLGDRVLGLVISEKLLDKFPDEKEGIIDKKFANLVNKKTCLLIAKKINLKKFILLGSSHKKLERSADKISSDCLEAIVGAIYLDGGLKSVEKFILNFWEEFLLKSLLL
jgi:ribonuclease-3